MVLFTPAELGSLVYEIFVFGVTFSVSLILFYRYFKKRNTNLLIFAFCIMLFSFAAICQGMDILIFDQLPQFSETAVGYNFAFSMSAYGNILLALFFLRIYEKEHVNLIVSIYAIINVANTIMLLSTIFLKSSYTFYPLIQFLNTTILLDTRYELGFPTIEPLRMFGLVTHLVLATILYVYMISAAIKSSKKDVSLKVRRGFQLIASFGLFLLLAFSFFLMDFLWGQLFVWFYSPWIYIGWTSAAVGAIMAYLGYVMPDWLKKRWEE